MGLNFNQINKYRFTPLLSFSVDQTDVSIIINSEAVVSFE